MDGPRDPQTKSVRERQIPHYTTYMQTVKKKIQMNLFTKRKSLTDIENKIMITKVGRRGGIN